LDRFRKRKSIFCFELYQVRKNLIHLKTNAEDDLTAYFKAIDKMLDNNIHQCISSTINMMNYTKRTFVEIKSIKNLLQQAV
jgi:macrodomain Ter protein organizer (MatP/YcbG family)